MPSQSNKKPIIYVAPDPTVLEAVAEHVCGTLTKTHGKAYSDPEVVDGLATFLKEIARQTAKAMTKEKAKQKAA